MGEDEVKTAKEAVRLLRVPAQEARAVIKAYEAAQAVANLEGETEALTTRRDTVKNELQGLLDDRTATEAENKERKERFDKGIHELEKRRDELVAENSRLVHEQEKQTHAAEEAYEQKRKDQQVELARQKATGEAELAELNKALDNVRGDIKKIQNALPKVA